MENSNKNNGANESLYNIGKSFGMANKNMPSADYKKRLIDFATALQKTREDGLTDFSANLEKMAENVRILKQKINAEKDEHVREMIALFKELSKILTPEVRADEVLFSAAKEFQQSLIDQYRKNNLKMYSLEDEINIAAQKLTVLLTDAINSLDKGKANFIANLEQIEEDYKILEKGFLYGLALMDALSNQQNS